MAESQMLATIQSFARLLNQYANLFLVVITTVYVSLTWRTLRALQQASLREREARHLQEIKEQVIEPIVSWISMTVFGRFAGISPGLLTVVGGYGGKPRQISQTVDDPFRAMRHLVTFADPPDAPDPLVGWTSLEHGRIPRSLYDHAKQNHFTEQLREFDRLLEDVEQLTGTFVVFANECIKEIAKIAEGSGIRCLQLETDELNLEGTAFPHQLVADCVHSLLGTGQVPGIEVRDLGSNPKLYGMHLGQSNPVAKGRQQGRLKHWCELGLEDIRKRWGAGDLPERVRNLLRDADGVRGKIAYLRFTHSLGVDCELVSGKKRRMRRFW